MDGLGLEDILEEIGRTIARNMERWVSLTSMALCQDVYMEKLPL